MIRFLAGIAVGVALTVWLISRSIVTAERPKVPRPKLSWPPNGTVTEHDGTQWTYTWANPN